MADNYSYTSPVFHVKNFSASNNLRFKYSMPPSSVSSALARVSASHSSPVSKTLSVLPYKNSIDNGSSSASGGSSLKLSRNYTAPLPSLSVSTAESLLLKSSMISPGSSRAVRYSRSSTAALLNNGNSALEVQRFSSNSYALLPSPSGQLSPSHETGGGRSANTSVTQRTPLLFPIMSKSLLRYRHSFTRSPAINRRCGSADPEIYRRISLSRQIPNYPPAASEIDRKGYSQSRSQSASCSNSRSSSIERYSGRKCTTGNGFSVGKSGSSSSLNKSTLKSCSRESSYSDLSPVKNGGSADASTSSDLTESSSRKGNRSNSFSEATMATVAAEPFPCITELARNVASHKWESTPGQQASHNENGYHEPIITNGNGTTKASSPASTIESSSSSGTDSINKTPAVPLAAVANAIITSSTENKSTEETSSLQTTNANRKNGFLNGTAENGYTNGFIPPAPPPPPKLLAPIAIAQSTTATVRKKVTTTPTATTTDINIDMKFVNGFVHLMNGGTSTSSFDRISTKSTRQKMRLAKLQNKYGAFKSWLTPEDEQTLARAEARLAARRQARAEAREIRMKELEKQQKEHDESADRHYDMYTPAGGGGGGGDVVNRAAFRVALGSHRGPSHSGSASYHSSRRSSEDSSEDGMVSIRDMRHELKELEDKFRKSMVHNAQLDNEKSALTYQVELLKDKIDDLEESLTLLQREYRDKCRDFENLKRLSTQLKDELEYCKAQLLEKEELIKEYGLVVVENEVEVDLGNGEKETRIKRSLVTQETAQVLSSLGSGSLDVRLKKFLEEKNDLLDQIRRLTIELEEERNKHSKGDRGGAPHNASNSSAYTNGPDEDCIDAQKDASKQLADYRFKTQKYEQEIATLQANVGRLDGQVVRFKTAAEEAESREDDLKIEKRKLQRELREAQSKLDELETTNSHLQKRLDKLKTAKSALLKEL